MRQRVLWVPVLALCLCAPGTASAQVLGTFRWQLQPYCNVVTLTLTQVGPNFTVDGTDDLCGAASPAAATGLAFPKGDGTFGFGVNVVMAPTGAPVHVSASITPATVSGTWQDSSGNAGAFVFNPAIAPGAPRPAPVPAFASGVSMVNTRITNLAAPSAGGDATNKTYVDAGLAVAKDGWIAALGNATIWLTSANLSGATIVRPAGQPTGVYCVNLPSGHGLSTPGAVASAQQSGGGNGVSVTAVVSSIYNTSCLQAGYPLGVYTYDAAGVLVNGAFTVRIPRY